MTVFFDWLDYLVFGAMLFFSALIGVYFAFFAAKKQNTTAEYLMGGKTMGMFPISMSLIARYGDAVAACALMRSISLRAEVAVRIVVFQLHIRHIATGPSC